MSDNATPVPSPEQPHEVDKSDINDNGDTNSELEGDNDMHADLHEDLNDEMDTKIPALGLHPRPGSEDNSLTDPSYNRSHSEAIDTVDRSRGHQNRDNNMEIREYDMRGAEGNNVDRESEAPNRHRRSLPTRNHRPRNFDFGAPALRDQGDADHPGFRRDRGRGAGNPDASNEEPVRPPVKVRKKPGPPKTVAPPIKKNDLDAKMALIREIEGHWGKDFIKTYVPKIHRPLVKRRQGKPRSINRKVEDKPMHWTPSVLKALLMIAKICDDKVKLKKIMGDVVRYRNQHTGNKKPQLVTTDFDVIEDILLKGWPVETSFGIRYKHLLQHRLDGRTDTQEKNDYYKHLFRDSDYSDEDGDDEEKANEDDDDTDAHGGLSNEFQLQSGYYEPPAQTSNLQYDDEHEQEPSIQVKRGRNYLHDMQMDLNNAPPNVNDRYGYGSKNPRHPPRTGAHVQPEVHYHNMNGNKRYGGSAQIPYNEMASRGMKTLDPYTHGRHHDDFLGGDDGKVAAYKRGRGRAGDFRQSHNGKFAYKQNNHDRFRGMINLSLHDYQPTF
jgi:hypothetical protein